MKGTNEKKKYSNLVKFVLVVACSVALLFTCSVISKKVVYADSGYDVSYDRGRSSSSSSSSSRNRSSSSSSSSSRNRSSSSSSSSSRDRSSSSSSSSSSYGSGTNKAEYVGILVLVFVPMIFYLIALRAFINRKPQSNNVVNENDDIIVNKAKELIPDFNKEEFIKEGYQIYLDVQDAWTNFKLDSVRDKISDEMFNMYQSQLSTMEVKGEQNIMRDFTKKNAYLKNVVKQNDNITITATYVIDFYDYIVEKSTGKVLRGSANTKMRVTYDMKFRKTLDASKVVDHCPNCGAKIEKINGAGVCEYCGSKVVSENAKWILTDKKNIGQTRA